MKMEENNENLYETRTNLLSSENIIEYLYRRCEKTIYPFKPDNSFEIKCREVDGMYIKGKEIVKEYEISAKDIKNADIKNSQEYNFEVDEFTTFNVEKMPVSQGKLVLIYRSDRKYYSLFELIEREDKKELHLIMKVKQQVGLFGSFQTEMMYYY